MIDKNLLLGEAAKIADTLRDIRRDLHRHPELGFEEFRTTEPGAIGDIEKWYDEKLGRKMV